MEEQEQIPEGEEPSENSLSALILGGLAFVVGKTQHGEVFLSIQGETSDKIYMTVTEALMLSLAFKQAVEEIASDH